MSTDERDEQARRLWLILHDEGRLISHSFTPPVTLDELIDWYPDSAIWLVPDDGEEEAA